METGRSAGVIGSGSFGIAMSKLLAINIPVMMLCRSQRTVDMINQSHQLRGISLSPNIRATLSVEELTSACRTLFPVVPSDNFREMMRSLAPCLRPTHFVIHCTKGFDILEDVDNLNDISRSQIHTMSEVIAEESAVLRIGCLSGPNLAREIIDGQPTATVIASEFTEVINEGRELLSSGQFFVFGSHDILGAEIAGALKNVFALGSGFLAGLGLGKNIQSMLITRGLHEIVYFGKAMGARTDAFLGTAGIGDLIATATSEDSRNFRFGYRLGKGERLEAIQQSIDEVAEGVRTLKIAMKLAEHYRLQVPITTMLYKVIYEQYPFETALDYLMRYPYARDVDFI
ncbi:MAG: NAD(P)H-dependent glycerol-3-phosphate dehydrogenase [Saprospiraceae bacterium]|nr:NAD(P)H-dependent glycerol-3-phosphate dehydrogenase [Saprospiraceae bacterium]